MIEELQHNKLEISNQIHDVFQASYLVEAKLLGLSDFPPLKRLLESYLKSENIFFGYVEHGDLKGVIEVSLPPECVDINSLVVHPKFFRLGIGRKLLEYVLNRFDRELFLVETAVDNKPAIALYKKLGFKEIKQWDTDFGIRKVGFERRLGDEV
ncbi:MAG: GNAT family N-acetyltransferase [Bacteroidota bacterium]